MSRFFAYLARFAVITIGYGCAALAASVFLHLLIFGGFDWRPQVAGEPRGGSILLFSVPFLALMAGYFGFLPALVAMVAAEVLGLRDWLFHSLAGAGVALVVTLVAFGAHGAFDGIPVLVMVAAGMFAGIAYWLVAGRSSGLLLDRVASGRSRSGS